MSVSSPASSCWADKQPWGSSSAWAWPPAGASLWCRGVCSGPVARRDMEKKKNSNEMKATAPSVFFSHLVEQHAQGHGEQQQGDGRHHHDEPQLPHHRLTPLTSLGPLSDTSSPLSSSGRSGTLRVCMERSQERPRWCRRSLLKLSHAVLLRLSEQKH